MKAFLYYFIYITVGLMGMLVMPFYLFLRMIKGKEMPRSLLHRFGLMKISAVDKKTIHIHAASVGELNSAIKLIKLYQNAEYRVILTTTTRASHEIVKKKLNGDVEHYFFPYDILPIMILFLKKLSPQKAVFIESEIWPAYLLSARIHNIPVYLVSARISERSMKKWQRHAEFAKSIFGSYKKILAQSTHDAQKFSSLVQSSQLSNVKYIGNLKYDTEIPAIHTDILQKLEGSIAGYTIILAASTHPGEEDMILDAYKQIHDQNEKTKLIIAVRHINRSAEVLELAKEYGFTAELHSQKQGQIDADIYINDTIGQMGDFYKIAHLVIMCGSFKDKIGGHNPIEAAYFDNIILTGIYFANQQEIYENFFGSNAAILMNNVTDLADIYDKYKLGKYDHYCDNAKKLVENYSNITDLVFYETQT